MVRAFGGADDGLSLVWGGIRGVWNSTSSAVNYIVVDQTGRAVRYAVRRGTRPMVSFANSTATTFSQTGEVLTINFNRGLGAAQNIGVLTVNAAGDVTWQAINGVVDGVQYAYENGAVIAQNFASMRCDQVLTLAFGGDFPYSTSNMGAASADCARNIAVGFACSLPGAVYDLVDSSVDWYRLVRRGMSEAPCNLVPIPPADAVCGALRASIRPAEAITRCLLKPQFQQPGGSLQFNGAVCRGIGDVALGVVLDIATAGATSRLLATKIARAVKAVYNIAGAIETVEGMVERVCGAELAQLSVSVPSPPTTYELWEHSNFTGTRVAVSDHVPNLGSFDERASAARVPVGGTMAVFSAPDFQGACDTFQRDVGGFRYLSVGNDRASSVRVGEYCPGRPRARLFANTNLEGRALELAVDLPELGSSGFDGETSSIAVNAGARLAVYSEPNYGGTCTQITAETRRLSDTAAGNDRVSSVRLDRPCERAAATLYVETGSRGNAVTIHADVENMVAASLQNTSSLALVGGMPLALYKEPYFQGPCLTVTGSLARMPSGWNDSIRSLKVNATCEGYREVMGASALVSADGRCLATRVATESVATCVAACPMVFTWGGAQRRPSCVNDCNRRQIVVQPCDGSTRQQWRMLGPLMINGENHWLTSPGGTSAIAGTGVFAGAVTSRPEMSWRMDSEQIINHQGRCLEVPRGAQWQQESVVRLSHCAGSVSERFAAVRVPSGPGFVRPAELTEAPSGELLSCSMDGAVREGVLCRARAESLVLSLGSNQLQTEPSVLPLRGALALTGSGATLPARDLHDPGSDSLSVSVWFNLASTSGTQTLVSNGATGPNVAGYNLAIRDGMLVFRAHATHSGADAGVAAVQAAGLSRAAPTTGAWHHFVAVIDRGSNTLRAALDGSDQGFAPLGTSTLAADATIRSAEALSLGASGAERPSNASIDALRIYPRALSAAEIATLAASRR
ncbi:MAG: hypothetical protein JNK05_35915 [Myxococcales bacterium]|nr:hypothetical protein [Myxococcales bacterium]